MTSRFPTDPVPDRPPARRARLIAAAALGAVLALGIGTWLWLRPRPAEPPLADLTGADPEVAEFVTEARREVLNRPASAGAWGRLGMVLRAHDFADEASVCFAEAERLDPREPSWPYLQGLTHLLTDPDLGIRCLERAVERCGDEPLAPRLRLAETLLERGRLDEAAVHFRRALGSQPDNRRAQLGLARLALLRENWQEALGPLAACREDEHARKQAHALLAETYDRLGETEKARAERARAAELPGDVRWPDPFIEAVQQLRRGLLARFAEADALLREGRAEEARGLLEETTEKYPTSVEAWIRLGEVCRSLRQLDRAEQAVGQAVRADPQSAEAWFRLGCVQASGRPREAAESFRRAIRLRPDHALAHFNLAHRLRELGDREGAAAEFREALRCRPDYTPAQTGLEELKTLKKTAP